MLPELLLGVENALTIGNVFIKINYKQWSVLYTVKIYKKPVEDINTYITETLSLLEEIPTDVKEFLKKNFKILKISIQQCGSFCVIVVASYTYALSIDKKKAVFSWKVRYQLLVWSVQILLYHSSSIGLILKPKIMSHSERIHKYLN